MTKTHKITSILILISVILLGLLCRPSFSMVHAYTDYNNYTYDAYRVDIVVKEDNSYDITESITMTYGDPEDGLHKGWARGIPYNYPFNFTDVNGHHYKYNVNAKVTLQTVIFDDTVSDYNYYTEDGQFVIEMKKNSGYINAEGSVTKHYVIKYNFAVGDDFVPSQDMFYYNIIGSDFLVDLHNVEFTITMPKSFDSSKLKFYTGAYGETTEYTDYTVSGNVISSNAPFNLQFSNALTINLDLPKDYYNIPSAKTYNTLQIVLPILSVVVLVVLALVLFFVQNRKTPTQVVEFYAPDDLSPADCKYIIDGKVSSLDVSSIIVVWASKGLVKIVLDDNKKPTSVARLKDMPETFTDDEKRIWKVLFNKNDLVSLDVNMEVSAAMQTTARLVKARYDGAESSRFTNKSRSKVLLLTLLGLVMPTTYLVYLSKYHGFGAPITLCLLISILLSLFLTVGYVASRFNNYVLKKNKLFVVLISLASVLPNVFAYFFYTPNVYDRALALIWYFILLGVINGIFIGKSLELNKKVFDMYGRVAGFKNAIDHAEADMLKKLVKDDPEYFYKVIPYAHVFGIYEKFVTKFSGFAIPINEDIGDTYTTILILNNLRYRSRYNMMRSQSSGAGSSFGGHGGFGGGFSGGGHGGGGGRGL